MSVIVFKGIDERNIKAVWSIFLMSFQEMISSVSTVKKCLSLRSLACASGFSEGGESSISLQPIYIYLLQRISRCYVKSNS